MATQKPKLLSAAHIPLQARLLLAHVEEDMFLLLLYELAQSAAKAEVEAEEKADEDVSCAVRGGDAVGAVGSRGSGAAERAVEPTTRRKTEGE